MLIQTSCDLRGARCTRTHQGPNIKEFRAEPDQGHLKPSEKWS